MPDLDRAPPTRFRVVERGRRLEVVDTDSGGAPASRTRSAAGQRPALRKIRFDGSAELTTSRLFDLKGPRVIRLDPVRAALVSRGRLVLAAAATGLIVGSVAWPWLLLLPVVLLVRNVRRGLLTIATAWLDRAERMKPD